MQGDRVRVSVPNPSFGWGSQGVNKESIGIVKSIVKEDGVALVTFTRPYVENWACPLQELEKVDATKTVLENRKNSLEESVSFQNALEISENGLKCFDRRIISILQV